MPKSKPSQVIVHRIELQGKERELLEELLASKKVENYASATKNALIPVGVVIVAGTAYFIADGIYSIWDKHSDRLQRVKDRIVNPSFEQAEEDTGSWWKSFYIPYILGFQ